MFVTLGAKTEPITTRSKTGYLGPTGPSSTSGIPRDSGPRTEHEARGAREYINPDIPTDTEAPTLTLENLERLGSRDPLAAALPSVVAKSECPSLSPSVARPDLANERLARMKEKEWRGKDVVGTIKTWDENCEMPYGEDAVFINTSEMFAD